METNEAPRELLEHVVISDPNAPQYMINGDLLQEQHGLVVDIAGGDFIPVNYTSEDLLTQDLTDEDRNLAAALVAVQLSQQQKHQQMQEAGTVTTLPSIVNNSGIGGKILEEQPIQAIITSEKGSNNSYLQIVGSESLYVEKQTLPKLVDGVRFTSAAGTISPTASYSGGDSSGVTITIKNEDDKRDSDGESLRNETRSSKKSLPHKKRISRKLKKPTVTAVGSGNSSSSTSVKKIVCNLCEQTFNSADDFHQHEILCQTTITPVNPMGYMSFNCQICNAPFTDQLKFFEHLKKHYEPPSSSTIDSKEGIIRSKSPTDQEMSSPTSPKIKNDATAGPSSASSISQVITKEEPSEKSSESLLSSLLCLTCIECNKTFRRQKTFEQHMRDVHTPKEEPMNDEFSDPEDLMEGINVVVNENDPGSDFEDCDDDSKAWYREEDLHQTEEDLKELEETNGHVCHLCKQPFPLRAILLQHLVTCRVLNADAEPAPVPKKKSPKKKGSLQCTECDRTFVHRNSLVYHMRSHTGIRPHQCDQCGKAFFASSALKVHLRLHTGAKPYTCSECQKKFRQWGDLKYHLTSIHSNEKNFQCEYCGKEFARKYSLIVHRRIHTGEKNYRCEFCGKTFRASSYLQNHRRIHTGEKPHSCEVCGKPFRVRSDMKRHQKTHMKFSSNAPSKSSVNTTTLVQAKIEECDEELEDEDNSTTAELHIGEEEEAASHILDYEQDPLEGGEEHRELETTVRIQNRNLYINGNELYLVTYPGEITH